MNRPSRPARSPSNAALSNPASKKVSTSFLPPVVGRPPVTVTRIVKLTPSAHSASKSAPASRCPTPLQNRSLTSSSDEQADSEDSADDRSFDAVSSAQNLTRLMGNWRTQIATVDSYETKLIGTSTEVAAPPMIAGPFRNVAGKLTHVPLPPALAGHEVQLSLDNGLSFPVMVRVVMESPDFVQASKRVTQTIVFTIFPHSACATTLMGHILRVEAVHGWFRSESTVPALPTDAQLTSVSVSVQRGGMSPKAAARCLMPDTPEAYRENCQQLGAIMLQCAFFGRALYNPRKIIRSKCTQPFERHEGDVPLQ